MAKVYPTIDRLHELFYYENGSLYRKIKPKKASQVKVGDKAGYVNKRGRNVICVDNLLYTESRLIWIFMGNKLIDGLVIDHIDGNPLNNNINNLRQVTVKENAQNLPRHREGKKVGIFFRKSTGKYVVTLPIGVYNTEDEANKALELIKLKLEEVLK